MRDELHKDIMDIDTIKKNVLNGINPKMPSFCPSEYTDLMKECWNIIPEYRPSFKDIVNKLNNIINNIHANIIMIQDTLPDPQLHPEFDTYNAEIDENILINSNIGANFDKFKHKKDNNY